ncbi:MAG: TonB-dependent receptor [Alphaproteobacteria bacterium]
MAYQRLSTFSRVLAASVATGAISLGLSTLAHAQSQQELPEIVIESAGLTPAEGDKTGSAYSVITGEELEQRQIRHAAEALRQIPGVAVGQSGGVGSMAQARVRGAEANHVVVRIDGVEVNSLNSGDFDFSTLLTADIERIEVLRGPQSGVYGSNALAGVINIVTKKGKGPARVSASAEIGSFNTRGATASASGGSDKGYLSVTASGQKTDGYNIARSGDEKDGSEQKSIFARGGISPTENFRINAMARLQENRNDFDRDANWDGLLDDTSGDKNIRRQRMARISAELDTLNKHWKHKLFADYLDDDLTAKGANASLNNGDRSHYGYETSVIIDTPSFFNARHTITGLVEHKHESFESNDAWTSASASRDQNGFAAEYRGEFGGVLFLTGNVRRDLNDAFDDATTYRTSASYLIKQTNTRVHASYGKGITNPTFFEQFGLYSGFVGNPNLTPEQSIGWDAGVEQTFLDGVVKVDVTYFNADLTDEIAYTSLPAWQFTYINADGTSKRQGVEVKLSLKPSENWNIAGSYTYTDTKDPDGMPEIRRPKHAASLNVNYIFADGRGQIGAGLIYNGKMDDTIFNGLNPRVTLDDYLLVNVAASYKLDDRITLFGRVENMLNTDYEEVYGYTSAPAAAYAGLKVEFTEDAPLEPMK